MTFARGPVRITAVIALALSAGLAVWLTTRGDGTRSTSAPRTARRGAAGPVSAGVKTVPVNEQGLGTLSGALKQPIYWAGPKAGYTYELTRETDGRVYVRYLPPGVKVGSKKALLTIGTYPVKNAFTVTGGAAAERDSVKIPAPGNGVSFYSNGSPTNVYVAYPGLDYQVEVFDPSARAARWVVTSGHLRAVPSRSPTSSSSTAPQGMTLTQLRAFARSVGHPVYWAGVSPGTTYEVTQIPDGKIYVRYLPRGAGVGTGSPYLTVGTYRVANALALTSGLAGRAGSVRVTVPGGGVAFYARQRPTNVYVAFPGVDYQIEVYDPSVADVARRVSSGQIGPIG